MASQSSDDDTLTVIHTNSGASDEKVVIDLSKFGTVSDSATADLYLTTTPDPLQDTHAATPEYMNQYSNVKQNSKAVSIDKNAKTATFCVPSGSIASLQISKVGGTSPSAQAIKNGGSYQVIGKQSNKMVAASGSGTGSSIELANPAHDGISAKSQT